MATTENPSRERILERVRNALRIPSYPPAVTPPRAVFPPIGDPLERLKAECAANKTELILATDEVSSAAAVESVLDPLPGGETFVQDAPDLRRMAASFTLPRNLRWSSEGGPSETAQATITQAEFLVAATGSILVSAACGGRGASVIAPCHIVTAKLSQLVPDLEEAMARVRASRIDSNNSFLCLVTGSSRTADIEKILVLGAHGPRRLVLVLATDR